MQTDQLRQVIRELAGAALTREDIESKDDFFDLGASSLTIVELQVQLEARLGLTAPTSLLLRSPSIQGWVGVYAAAMSTADASEANAAQ